MLHGHILHCCKGFGKVKSFCCQTEYRLKTEFCSPKNPHQLEEKLSLDKQIISIQHDITLEQLLLMITVNKCFSWLTGGYIQFFTFKDLNNTACTGPTVLWWLWGKNVFHQLSASCIEGLKKFLDKRDINIIFCPTFVGDKGDRHQRRHWGRSSIYACVCVCVCVRRASFKAAVRLSVLSAFFYFLWKAQLLLFKTKELLLKTIQTPTLSPCLFLCPLPTPPNTHTQTNRGPGSQGM